ncbi:MAG: glucose-6-phosphate dehydrogenase assembly protein OpcA [Chloroflexota bacterium]|nr:glucose-6-phosphate dehydrogenase assembly protein OpcA [Chloroflexota bacterium]
MTERILDRLDSTALMPPPGKNTYEDVIIRGEAKEIELANIEKSITTLWQVATKDESEDLAPVMRACVFNLVIFTESDEGLEQATDTIAKLTWSYPCRAIVLIARPNLPEDSMNAWISAQCQLPDPNGMKVCCEQVTVEGSNLAMERLGSMVLPLLVPDLPVILWWPGDPTLQGPLFERLMDTSDRLIVDSRRFLDPVCSFKRLAALSEMRYRGVAFSDLNWARLTPWRRLIAQFFDPPNMMPYLSHFEDIVIDYEAPGKESEPNFSQALLLVGWLGHQLGWKEAFSLQKHKYNASLIVNAGGKPLNIKFIGHNDCCEESGGITAIKITATILPENRAATFSIKLKQNYEQVEISTEESSKPPRSRALGFVRRDEVALLSEDLAVVKHDRMYEAALALAGKLTG